MTLAHAEHGADADGVLDIVSLSDHRILTVRTVTEADVEGLDALFEGLSEDDRYYRFFCLSHPGRRFLEQMARAEDEGGYRLVAVVSGAENQLVAEAGYALLPDGNGEFALTVAGGWRGWLGPYLLDAIVAVAAARGVPNLQADILVSNIRMLALVSNRGYVTLDREASQVRVAIDAAQPRPSPRSGAAPAMIRLSQAGVTGACCNRAQQPPRRFYPAGRTAGRPADDDGEPQPWRGRPLSAC